jgi:HrpA-like RNA helicase
MYQASSHLTESHHLTESTIKSMLYLICALQVRHDKRVGASSAVRFLTDGVLMRQLQSDFLLRTYSIILLDEAHERSLNTDLLLGE